MTPHVDSPRTRFGCVSVMFFTAGLRIGLDWIGAKWIGVESHWIRVALGWIGLDWLRIGLDWIGLEWTGFH